MLLRDLGTWLRRHGDGVLWAILGLGLLLRLCTLIFYTPTVFNYYGGDSSRYMRLPGTGFNGLFSDVAMPAGYPAFLEILHSISSWLPLTTFVQHLLGLAAAALLYFAVVRAGAPCWAALLPAAVIALSGDQLFLEHGILTEALWIPGLALAMYLLASSLRASNPLPWLAAGGSALVLASLVRNLSMVLIVLLALWAVVAIPATLRLRLRNGAAVLIPALLILGLYLGVSKSTGDGRSGLFENEGFALYARTAQFADCNKFTPPEGTRVLCVDTRAAERPGPFWWAWSPESPLRAKFQFDVNSSHDQELLEKFAKEAIRHQPLAYLDTATSDFVRFFAPEVGNGRIQNGVVPQYMSFGSATPVNQAFGLKETAEQVATKYTGVGDGEAGHAARAALGSYQSVFRVDGLLGFLLIVLTAIGAIFGRGAIRAGAALFLISGMTLLIIPPATSSYDARYAVPPMDLLAAGAAFGLAVIADLIARRRSAAQPEPDSPTTLKNSSYSRM
jgi:hypothetical protein